MVLTNPLPYIGKEIRIPLVDTTFHNHAFPNITRNSRICYNMPELKEQEGDHSVCITELCSFLNDRPGVCGWDYF
jgi:hypothetical protein